MKYKAVLTILVSGIAGMLAYQVVVYGSVILIVLVVGVGHLAFGEGFDHGVDALSLLRESAITQEAGLKPISAYGIYLMVIAAIGAFLGGRVAGWLCPNREYLSATITVLAIYGVAYVFDFSDLRTPIWYVYGTLAGCALAALFGAHRARRSRILGLTGDTAR
jgi:hypothetical protein